MMRLDEIQRTDGAVDKPIRGLHDAQPGDIIEIGIEGTRNKSMTRIKKIVGQNRLVDTNGNIFNRNGVVYRRAAYPLTSFPGKIISARHATQAELDANHEKRKVDFLKSKNWEDVDPEIRDQVLKMLRVSFTSMQGTKEYK